MPKAKTIRKRMTFAQFLARLPKTGWLLDEDGAIYRLDGAHCYSGGTCPWHYVVAQPGVYRRFYQHLIGDAAQNLKRDDPRIRAIRAALLKACGLA